MLNSHSTAYYKYYKYSTNKNITYILEYDSIFGYKAVSVSEEILPPLSEWEENQENNYLRETIFQILALIGLRWLHISGIRCRFV
jgi:hypothetical protein